MGQSGLLIIPLVAGYLMDLLIGDPEGLPHPVRVFGTLIYRAERQLNRRKWRFIKGMTLTMFLIALTFWTFYTVNRYLVAHNHLMYIVFNTVFVFYGLAGTNLIDEGKKVFTRLRAEGLEAGRKQLSRIVGRETSALSAGQIRTAVLETMSENLSDGVIAPLFYYAIAGVPGMMAYKMCNTLDSMIGYRSERYEYFGKFAARTDDVANLIPARLTAVLMSLMAGSKRAFRFLNRYARMHKSPNAGYPEAALAGILDLRFGGPNTYHGTRVEKPFIGSNDRDVTDADFTQTRRINQLTGLLMVVLIVILLLIRGK